MKAIEQTESASLIMINPWMGIDQAEAEANVKAAHDAGDMEVIALPYETIAAAHDLLRACEAIVACSKYWANAFSGERKALQLAQAAIAKALPNSGQSGAGKGGE